MSYGSSQPCPQSRQMARLWVATTQADLVGQPGSPGPAVRDRLCQGRRGPGSDRPPSASCRAASTDASRARVVALTYSAPARSERSTCSLWNSRCIASMNTRNDAYRSGGLARHDAQQCTTHSRAASTPPDPAGHRPRPPPHPAAAPAATSRRAAPPRAWGRRPAPPGKYSDRPAASSCHRTCSVPAQRPVRGAQPVSEPLLQGVDPLLGRGREPEPTRMQGRLVPRVPPACRCARVLHVRPLLAPPHQEGPPVVDRVRQDDDPGSHH